MDDSSIEQQHFRVSVRVAAGFIVFCIVTVSAAAMWAQNITNHLTNVDTTLVNVQHALERLPEITAIQERTSRHEERLQKLEEWRIDSYRPHQ